MQFPPMTSSRYPHARTASRFASWLLLVAFVTGPTTIGAQSLALEGASIGGASIGGGGQSQDAAELRRQLRQAERELARVQRQLERSVRSDRWAVVAPRPDSEQLAQALDRVRVFQRGRLGITVETERRREGGRREPGQVRRSRRGRRAGGRRRTRDEGRDSCWGRDHTLEWHCPVRGGDSERRHRTCPAPRRSIRHGGSSAGPDGSRAQARRG